MQTMVGTAITSPERLAEVRAEISNDLWARQWPVLRDGRQSWVKTSDLTVEDLMLLAVTTRSVRGSYRRWARRFEERAEQLQMAGVERLGRSPSSTSVAG
jgi:hypothetical protein